MDAGRPESRTNGTDGVDCGVGHRASIAWTNGVARKGPPSFGEASAFADPSTEFLISAAEQTGCSKDLK